MLATVTKDVEGLGKATRKSFSGGFKRLGTS